MISQMTILMLIVIMNDYVDSSTWQSSSWQLLEGNIDARQSCLDAASSTSTLPQCRYDMDMKYIRYNNSDKLYMFGGYLKEFLAPQLFNDLWEFDVKSQQWKKLLDIDCNRVNTPSCRSGLSLVAYNSSLYIIGGEQIQFYDYSKEIWEYSLKTESWTLKSNIPFSDSGVNRAAVTKSNDGNIYLYGGLWQNSFRNATLLAQQTGGTINVFSTCPSGCSFTQAYRNDLLRYNIMTGVWTELYSDYYGNNKIDCYNGGPPCSHSSSLISYKDILVTFAGEKLVYSGGIWRLTVTNDLWYYNLTNSNWYVIHGQLCDYSPVPNCRLGHTATLKYPYTMVVVGGVSFANGQWTTLNDVWEMDLDGDQKFIWRKVLDSKCNSNDATEPECSMWSSSDKLGNTGQEMIMFGGYSFSPGTQSTLNQIWSFRHSPYINTNQTYNGTTRGNTSILIEGLHFGYEVEKISVKINNKDCEKVSLLEENKKISCNSPPGAGSMNEVKVIISSGGTWTSNVVYFNYTKPSISSILYNVSNSKTDGLYWLTVLGNEFGTNDSAPVIYINNKKCISTIWLSYTTLKCQVPAGIGTELPIKVVVKNQQVIKDNGFSYLPPKIISTNKIITATIGGNNEKLDIYGENFGQSSDQISIDIGNHQCSNIQYNSSTHISCLNIPPGTGANVLIRVHIGGQVGELISSSFSYMSPVIYAIEPVNVLLQKQNTIIIKGDNFGQSLDVGSKTVQIGSKYTCLVETLIVQHKEIECSTPILNSPQTLPVTVVVNGQSSNVIHISFIYTPISEGLIYVAGVIGVMCILVIIVFAVLVSRYRSHKIIRASSIPFMFCVLFGSTLMIIPIFFLQYVNSEHRASCFAGVWFASIGFTVLYGSMLLKNARILWIFRGKVVSVRAIKNSELAVWLVSAVAVDIIFLSISTFGNNDRCTELNSFSHIFGITVILLSKLIIVIAGVIIAYKSRVIHAKEFNECHQLGYAFYNVALCSLFLLPASTLMKDDMQGLFILRLLSLTLISMVAVLCLFTIKFFRLFKRKLEGDSSSSRVIRLHTANSMRSQIPSTIISTNNNYSVTTVESAKFDRQSGDENDLDVLPIQTLPPA